MYSKTWKLKKIETQSNWKSEYAKQMGEHWIVLYWPHFFNFTREQQKYIKQNIIELTPPEVEKHDELEVSLLFNLISRWLNGNQGHHFVWFFND